MEFGSWVAVGHKGVKEGKKKSKDAKGMHEVRMLFLPWTGHSMRVPPLPPLPPHPLAWYSYWAPISTSVIWG